MADNSTFITGVQEGAFADAFDGLPPWATEDTANQIQGLLAKMLKLQTDSFATLIKNLVASRGSTDPAAAQKANDELEDYIKNLKDVNAQAPKDKKRWKDEEDEDRKKKARRLKTNDAYIALTGIIISAGIAIKRTFVENVSTFDQLYAAGIDVVNGMEQAATGFEAIQQLSVITGVRFTELAKSIERYSTAVNAFGIGKFAKTLGAASASLTQFGFSTKEGADLLGAYLESQQGYADMNSKTQAEVQKDLITFGQRVTGLSQATGISRTKMLENIDAISQSIEANILAGQVGNDAAASTLEFISSFKDQNLGKSFLKMMTDTIKPLNNTFMDFQKTGFGGFGQKMMAFTQSLQGLDPREAAQRTADFAKANDQELKMMISRANLLQQAGVKEADGVLSVATGLIQQGNTYKYVSDLDRKKADESAKASKDLQNQWERLMSQLQQAFAPTIPMLINLAHGLTWINTKIEAFAGLFDNSTKAWTGAGVVIAGAILGLKTLTKTIGALTTGLGGLLGKVFNIGSSKGGAGAASGSAGKGSGILGSLGKGIGELGKGLGAGLGGILKGTLTGLAEGLTALGNPRVLLGVLALAGISAGLWIAGKAVQQFVGLDWETMAKAGVVLVALGLAGAAAGAMAPLLGLGALAIAGLGAALWVVGKAIQAVGPGISSLAEGLKKMGEVKASNLLQTSVAIGGLTAALVAFAGASLASFASGKALDTLDGIVGTVNKLDLAKVNALNNIGNISLPKSTTATKDLTTPKLSTLNSPSASPTKVANSTQTPIPGPQTQPTGTGIEKPAANAAINSMLGYQNSLLEQLLQSTNNLVSVNKDILKYTRVHT